MSAPTGQSSTTLPGEVRAVGLVLEGGDDRGRSAVDGDELAVLRDVLREARAAVAEDAALAVERDQRRDRDRLVERPLGEVHAGRPRAEAEGEVLQWALAALVAVRAVERMVQEDELEDRVLALRGLLARERGLEDEAVRGRERAGGLELRQPLHLAEAHPAGADGRAEPRLVAEDRDLDADRRGRLDHALAPGSLELLPVDRDGDELGLCVHCRTSVTIRAPRVRFSALGSEAGGGLGCPGVRRRRAKLMARPVPRSRSGRSRDAGRRARAHPPATTRRRTGSRPRRCGVGTRP